MSFWRVGEPKFFPPPFGFCPFRARVIWGDFHRALPCAMVFLPRWGVRVCFGDACSDPLGTRASLAPTITMLLGTRASFAPTLGYLLVPEFLIGKIGIWFRLCGLLIL
jgi:hypothetical protein